MRESIDFRQAAELLAKPLPLSSCETDEDEALCDRAIDAYWQQYRGKATSAEYTKIAKWCAKQAEAKCATP